jgi:hypothetical protein
VVKPDNPRLASRRHVARSVASKLASASGHRASAPQSLLRSGSRAIAHASETERACRRTAGNDPALAESTWIDDPEPVYFIAESDSGKTTPANQNAATPTRNAAACAVHDPRRARYRTTDNDRREPRPHQAIAQNRVNFSHSSAPGERARKRRLQSRRRGVATRTAFGSPQARRVRQRCAPRL